MGTFSFLSAKNSLIGGRLEIEITESALLEERGQVLTIIRSFKNVGISISLDGLDRLCALAQVNRFPLDRIKIDKSFITTIKKSNQTVVNTIAGLGHNLDVPITPKGGIGTDPFGAFKIRLFRGLFGRVLSGDAVRAFLKRGRRAYNRNQSLDGGAKGGEPSSQAALMSAVI